MLDPVSSGIVYCWLNNIKKLACEVQKYIVKGKADCLTAHIHNVLPGVPKSIYRLPVPRNLILYQLDRETGKMIMPGVPGN